MSSAAEMMWVDTLGSLRLPEPSASTHWVDLFSTTYSEAKQAWKDFLSLQEDIDDIVINWYGLDNNSRVAIKEGLPWATR